MPQPKSTSHHWCTKAAVLFALALASPAVVAQTPPGDFEELDFARDIEPIFKQHCIACHGPNKQESEFRLDVRTTLLKGGDLGEPAVVPGKSAESNLIRFVSGLDPDVVMPPEGERLTQREVALLRAWIDQGAKMPELAARKRRALQSVVSSSGLARRFMGL